MSEPIDLSERSIQNLTSAITAATRGGSGAPQGGGGSGSATGGAGGASAYLRSMIDPFGRAVSGTTDVLRGFTTGTYDASSALKTFGTIAGVFGPAGTAISGAITGITAGMMDVNTSLRSASQNGVYFGQNLGLYARAVNNSRMTMAQFNDIIKYSGQSLNGLAGNMDHATLTYLKLGKRLQDDPLTYNLATTGMGLDEFNKSLLLTVTNNKFADLSRKENQNIVLSSAMSLAVELDNVARLTGKNRVTMQQEMEARASDVGYRLLKASATQEQLAGIQQGEAIAKAYGGQAEKVAQIFATGGPMNKSQTETVANMDPKMVALLQQLVKVEGVGEGAEARRNQIREQLNLRSEEIRNDKEASKTKIALSYSDNAAARQNALAQAELAEAGNRTAKDRIEAEKQGLYGPEGLRKYQEQQAKILAESRVPGKSPEGVAAVPAQTINQAEILIKDLGKGVATGFDKLNTTVGTTISRVEGLNNVLRPFSEESVNQAARNILNAVTPGRASGARDTTSVEPPATRPPTRFGGSKDATGSWFENFGAGKLMELHGKEAVVPQAKIGEFINDMMKTVKMPTSTTNTDSNMGGFINDMMRTTTMSTGAASPGEINPKQLSNVFGDATSGLKGELSKVKDMMPTTAAFEKMFSQIKMPDFGEITRNMPQTSTASSQSFRESDAMTTMASGIASLNTRMERLITAVTDSSDKSVRALKTRGNALS